MAEIDFTLSLPSSKDNLVKIYSEYEKLSEFMPNQLKKISILEKNENETITEEVLMFSSFLKKEITQKSKHIRLSTDEFETIILSGPAKDTTVKIIFKNADSKTDVFINCNLKLSLKARILQPILLKHYKSFLTSTLNRMAIRAMNSQ